MLEKPRALRQSTGRIPWRIALLILLTPLAVWAADDFQTWQWLSLTLWKEEGFRQDDKWLVQYYADNRMADDSRRQKVVLTGPLAKYLVGDNLELEAGYLAVGSRNLTTDLWSQEHRMLYEVNPRFRLGERWNLHNRNRLEFRWRESRPLALRSRHRLQLRYRLDWGPLRAAYSNNEFFYDYEQNRYNENRLIPIGLDFKTGTKSSISLFYMIQSVRRPTTWDDNHIFGTHFKYTF